MDGRYLVHIAFTNTARQGQRRAQHTTYVDRLALNGKSIGK